MLHVHQAEMLQMPRAPRGKSALSPPRAKSAPRRSKSTTLSKGICQPFEHRNTFLIYMKADFGIYGSSLIHVSQRMFS